MIRSTPSARSSVLARVTRRMAVGLSIILGFLIVTTGAHAALTAIEKRDLPPYGETVVLERGKVTVTRSGGPGPTLVLLSGYGTAAPAVDFAPFIRELDAYDVIVVEGFGYGFSDLDVVDRSIGAIAAELHETLAALGVDEPVVLVGHSVGGVYARYYAATYPEEVSAVVGIDPMALHESSTEAGEPSEIETVVGALGLHRLAATVFPGLVQPTGDAYTEDERRRIAAMATWNYGNAALADEWARIGANAAAAAELPFPDDVPVLQVLSTESAATIPRWLVDHEEELRPVADHRIEMLEGGHYLHWTQSTALADLITDFLSTRVTP